MENNFNDIKIEEENTPVQNLDETIIDLPKLQVSSEVNNQSTEEKKKRKKPLIIIIIVVLLIAGGACYYFFFMNNKKDEKKTTSIKQTINPVALKTEYKLVDNNLNDFDLYFLKQENKVKKETDIVYSPLSIKYALLMLAEGADGETKNQIITMLGQYAPKTYPNDMNMAFANALFVRNSFSKEVLPSYKETLKNKFNAFVIDDEFKNANNINSWVKNNTLGLIDKMFKDEDVKDIDYYLLNSLAIDMEWVNKIQNENNEYLVDYPYVRDGYIYIPALKYYGYDSLEFDKSKNVASLGVGASIYNYDVIEDFGGEEAFKNYISQEYEKLFAENEGNICENDIPKDDWINKRFETIKSYKGKYSSSTDFLVNDTDNELVFAKDLKTYNGITLQYVGIMPKNDTLENYINSTNTTKVKDLISNLKTIDPANFESGHLYSFSGSIPIFSTEYNLDLKKDLINLGITDVFDSSRANLSKFTKSKDANITSSKSNNKIDFSNDGIKAASGSGTGGSGGGPCVDIAIDPKEKRIDLTFNKPYMYLIRDKNSGEVWFVGSVYNPTDFEKSGWVYKTLN